MGESIVIGCRQKRVEELDRPTCSSRGAQRSKVKYKKCNNLILAITPPVCLTILMARHSTLPD